MDRLEWITAELAKYGLTYLKGNILNLKEKMWVICQYCGKQKNILFRCRTTYGCRERANDIKRREIEESLPEKIKKFGYTLSEIDQPYENAIKTKLSIICANGHKRETTYSNLRHHPQCQVCEKESRFKLASIKIKKHLKELDYTLIHIIYDAGKKQWTLT